MKRYDKMGQMRRLLNSMKENCRNAWNIDKCATIDEMMIRYKKTYFLARQYML